MGFSLNASSCVPFSKFFEQKVVKKRQQKQKEIVGAVPRESLLTLGWYLNQTFTIQGNYKNRAWLLVPSERIHLDKKAYIGTLLTIVSVLRDNVLSIIFLIPYLYCPNVYMSFWSKNGLYIFKVSLHIHMNIVISVK